MAGIAAVARAIHQRQVAEHGGSNEIRDEGLLLSALARPERAFAYQRPKPTIAFLAALYADGICNTHPFIDGNKRVALVVCQLFLELNGYILNASQKEKYCAFMQLATGKQDTSQLRSWLAKNLIPKKRTSPSE